MAIATGNTCCDQETFPCPRTVLVKGLIYDIAILQLYSGSGEEQKPITINCTHLIIKGAGQSINQWSGYQVLLHIIIYVLRHKGFLLPGKCGYMLKPVYSTS
jgi:hypothetical protein